MKVCKVIRGVVVRNGLRFDGGLSDRMVSSQGYERTRESGETLKYGGVQK